MHAPLAPPPPLTTDILVGAVSAVLLAVAEEVLLDAGAVTAGQLTGLVAQGSVGHQEGLHLPLSRQFITVLHSPFPVTGLFLQIEGQPRGTPDGLQTLRSQSYMPENESKNYSLLQCTE